MMRMSEGSGSVSPLSFTRTVVQLTIEAKSWSHCILKWGETRLKLLSYFGSSCLKCLRRRFALSEIKPTLESFVSVFPRVRLSTVFCRFPTATEDVAVILRLTKGSSI